MRVTFATLWVILVGLVVAHLEAPVIAVSAAGFTVLFLLYVAETQPFEDDLFTSIATVVSGGVIGFLFAFFIGPIETRTVVSFPAPGLTSGVSLRAAILIPLLAQVGMILPLLIVWTRRSRHGEALDGFAIGAAGALGFVTAMTFTNFAPQFSGGVLTTQGFVPVLTEAVVRGITVPLLSAALTGYIGATLWVKIRERRELDAGNRWLARPGAAFLVAIALQIGMGFADLAHLNDPLILVVHLAGVLLAVVAMRIGLHHVLLHEEHTFVIGPPRACPNCHHLTPSMPFCPECGVAETATSKRHRNREASLYPGPTSSPDAEVVA
jgi:RsiW-degrading membrane proteinase PrsW (M82 family)